MTVASVHPRSHHRLCHMYCYNTPPLDPHTEWSRSPGEHLHQMYSCLNLNEYNKNWSFMVLTTYQYMNVHLVVVYIQDSRYTCGSQLFHCNSDHILHCFLHTHWQLVIGIAKSLYSILTNTYADRLCQHHSGDYTCVVRYGHRRSGFPQILTSYVVHEYWQITSLEKRLIHTLTLSES